MTQRRGRPPAVPSEDALQASVVDFLAVALPLDAVAFSVPNQRVQPSVAELARLVRGGMLVGCPDLAVVWRGRLLFVEMKTSTGRVSSAQREAHGALREAGCPIGVCRSVEAVSEFLERNGIRLRARLT